VPSLMTVFRWQFDLTWSLLDGHLGALQDDDYLWEPVDGCWTVREVSPGVWLPDWEEPEPVPAPPSTIGWVAWHIGWWWTETIARASGSVPPSRSEIGWPGSASATATWLNGLRTSWLGVLDRLTEDDLEAIAPYPWQDRQDRTVAHMIGWVNAELMKNAAEIGNLRFLRAAELARAEEHR
jgi:DinB superfamily